MDTGGWGTSSVMNPQQATSKFFHWRQKSPPATVELALKVAATPQLRLWLPENPGKHEKRRETLDRWHRMGHRWGRQVRIIHV